MSSYESLVYELADGIATVTLNRPDKHNSFSPQLIAEIRDVWQKVRFDADVRCVVVTGAGDKAFSTGIDLTYPHPQPPSKLMMNDPMLQIGPKSNDVWKPVIAAVNGMACGGAFYLLGEVDVLIAADHATFFDPHVTYGMPAVYEPLLMLHRGMPFGEILRVSLLGNHERLSAERALQIGLLSEVCGYGELDERAMWLAEAIASAPSGPVQATLRTLWAGLELNRRQALNLGNTFLNLGMSEESLAEGQKVFQGSRIEPRTR